MALMEWTPEFSVKVERFDFEHKKILEFINKLHTAMFEGQGDAMRAVIFKELEAYTTTHFHEEEKIMQTHDYPGLAEQKAEHERFIVQVKKFQEGNAVSLTVVNFLKDWLLNHIKVVDQKYSSFLNSKGVR